MAGLGRRTFAAGEVLTASNVMGYLQDQAVMNFAGTAARGSAIGTAVSQGMISFLQDSGTIETYYDTFGTANPGGRDTAGWYQTTRSNGLIPVAPTSVAFVTGSGSVNSLGVISFTNTQQIEMRGIFSSKYRNYKIVFDAFKSTGSLNRQIYTRLMSGTTSINVSYQSGFNGIEAGYTATTNANASTLAPITYLNGTGTFTGGEITVFRPNLAEITHFMSDAIGFAPGNALYRSQSGNVNTNTTAYDGLILGITDGDAFTGKVQVFGIIDK